MNSYAVDSKPILLLKRAIDVFAEGERFHHSMMLHCQLWGYHGHKRWNRVQSHEDRCHRIEVENYCIDMFGDIIEPSWDFMDHKPKSYGEYLDHYLNWEIKVYKEITSIANELVANNYNCESDLVASCLKDVRKEIEKVRRWKKENEMVVGDEAYLLMKDRELHEKVKKIEEE